MVKGRVDSRENVGPVDSVVTPETFDYTATYADDPDKALDILYEVLMFMRHEPFTMDDLIEVLAYEGIYVDSQNEEEISEIEHLVREVWHDRKERSRQRKWPLETLVELQDGGMAFARVVNPEVSAIPQLEPVAAVDVDEELPEQDILQEQVDVTESEEPSADDEDEEAQVVELDTVREKRRGRSAHDMVEENELASLVSVSPASEAEATSREHTSDIPRHVPKKPVQYSRLDEGDWSIDHIDTSSAEYTEWLDSVTSEVLTVLHDMVNVDGYIYGKKVKLSLFEDRLCSYLGLPNSHVRMLLQELNDRGVVKCDEAFGTSWCRDPWHMEFEKALDLSRNEIPRTYTSDQQLAAAILENFLQPHHSAYDMVPVNRLYNAIGGDAARLSLRMFDQVLKTLSDEDVLTRCVVPGVSSGKTKARDRFVFSLGSTYNRQNLLRLKELGVLEEYLEEVLSQQPSLELVE